MMDRDYMLKVIWRSIPDYKPCYKWLNGSRTFYYKGVKIEDIDSKIEIYLTMSSLYRILPTSAVWYAYTEGMDKLSESVILTVYEGRLSNKKIAQTPQTLESYKRKVDKLTDNGVINLNQIQENYERQSTTSEAV